MIEPYKTVEALRLTLSATEISFSTRRDISRCGSCDRERCHGACQALRRGRSERETERKMDEKNLQLAMAMAGVKLDKNTTPKKTPVSRMNDKQQTFK